MFKRLKKKKKPAVQAQTQRQDGSTQSSDSSEYLDPLIGIASTTILDDEPTRRTTSSSDTYSSSSSDSGSSFDSGSYD